MKTRDFILFISAGLMAAACGGEGSTRIDQLDESLPAPSPVTVTKVTPKPGGAVLWVEIPDDPYIKGVVAKYERGGEIVDAKISRYVDSLEIEGLATTDECVVNVYSFNVNETTSEPVQVSFIPETPTIQTVSWTVTAAPGGLKIKVSGNYDKSDLAVCLLRDENVENASLPVSQVKWKEVTTLFTASNDITLTRRNLEPVEALYGIYIRDRWGNMTDTLSAVLTPFEEVQIPKTNFSYAAIADDNIFSMQDEMAYYPVRGLWDGSGTSAHYCFMALDMAPVPAWLTIDMGCVVELSRIETLPRIDYPTLYGDAHVRNFEFWGSMEPSGKAGSGEHGFDDSWFLIGKFVQQKPSGYEADGSSGTVTQEDREAFNAGNDFEMNTDEYPHATDQCRYLRVVLTSFIAFQMPDAASQAIQFGEVTPYGRVVQ